MLPRSPEEQAQRNHELDAMRKDRKYVSSPQDAISQQALSPTEEAGMDNIHDVPQIPPYKLHREQAHLGARNITLPERVDDIPFVMEKSISDDRIEDVPLEQQRIMQYLVSQRFSDYSRRLVPLIIDNFKLHQETMDMLEPILVGRKGLYKKQRLLNAWYKVELLLKNYNCILVQMTELNEFMRVHNLNLSDKLSGRDTGDTADEEEPYDEEGDDHFQEEEKGTEEGQSTGSGG